MGNSIEQDFLNEGFLNMWAEAAGWQHGPRHPSPENLSDPLNIIFNPTEETSDEDAERLANRLEELLPALSKFHLHATEAFIKALRHKETRRSE